MKGDSLPIIYTIGHSTRSIQEFIQLLINCNIQLLADIRRYPGSRKFPMYNMDALQIELQKAGFQYVHLSGLGGRRKRSKDSINDRWRKDTFRGYADYMGTDEFAAEMKNLMTLAENQVTAIMCAEAVWWRCHRALVSDYLKVSGWKVIHIMGLNKQEEHPFTSAARVVNHHLYYSEDFNSPII